ncbi:aspartyl/asparaginyl beta-hydroxylase domain-containing protein [Nostoc sp. PCC 9305]|uniref:aspartyl/asparaginyl beta-hydroxylase domain-containing protein n=1 Tax=Nostoc sp. PCC 9305 TaxID=296636 RepID=UPI0039C683B4
MISLYNLNGKKYFSVLLICQLSVFLIGLFFVLLFVLDLDGRVEISNAIISIPLLILYGILALWIGLFWKALSQIIFSHSSATRTIFQRWFLIPLNAFCLIGAYATHTLLLLHQGNNHFVIAFLPLLLAGILGVFTTSFFVVKLLRSIKDDETLYIRSQKILDELKEKFGTISTKRIELSINMASGKSVASPTPDQQGFQVMGLMSKPWYDMSDLPGAKLLENSYEIIRQEALEAIKNKSILEPYHYLGVNRGGWDSVELIEAGKKIEKNSLHLPKTVSLLEKISNHTRLTDAALSVLKPGEVIKPHRDPDNFHITCHLGIVIPNKCGISVAGESRTWEEGKCLFFDSSYEHTAWNNSDTPRVVLLLIFYKPELTDIEKDFLQYVFIEKFPDRMIISPEEHFVSQLR